MNTEIIHFFHTLPKDDDGHFIVGMINQIIIDSINAKVSYVVISEVSLKKNIAHHEDLDIVDYKKLSYIVMNHHVVIQDGEKTVGVVHIEEDKYYFALKATASGETVFLTSFRKTSDLDLKRLKKKVEKKKAVLIFGSL
ncbi:MAG: hypothetical protein PHQ90_09740 [Sulfuricurvum sp.]|uniref:hypothetical protein n=1 Tax=Sulfuricurvum sp. TaxID=2025608 RepID=UPI00260AB7C7|nr:hypothetical protein [Sulfuricurvum sp.]MDD2369571.1 hypothetical protein [Sulfuricurvum sp.]MDD2950173.1 hypothetical protein [Sulfuricurvum sp.]MDD5118844.1 hypothetical protein [Sulfuricurvum sp.]